MVLDLMGVSLAVDLGFETVSVVGIVDDPSVTVGLDQGVVPGDGVSITLLLLLFDVSGLLVMHGIVELVVGGGVMMIVMMATI